MKRDDIYVKLIQRYASESPEMLREVSYNLSLANVAEANLMERAAAAIAKLKAKPAQANPLGAEAKKIRAAHLAVCSVCKSQMSLVKLLEGREVYYCPDHRIAQPLPVEGE